MDPKTKVPMQKTISGPITGTVTFSSPITVGSTPMAIGFDMDLAASVAADSDGNLNMNPVFHVTSGMQGVGDSCDPMNGGIQQIMGSVASASGGSFTMASMQSAQTFTFAMNSSTTLDGTSMSGMMGGTLVMVDASLQVDGSLMAAHVQSLMSSGGFMGGGIITAVTGNPATALTIVMQNGMGTGMMSTFLANGDTVDLSGNTTFAIDKDNMDMSGLPFTPAFDNSHVYAGQNVMPISSGGLIGGAGGGMMGGNPLSGTMTASDLILVSQGVTGTATSAITNGATASFTLSLPTGSAFTTLTGATSVEVFQQSRTIVAGPSPIASGASVHVFGLLFLDGGQWKIVAARMGAN